MSATACQRAMSISEADFIRLLPLAAMPHHLSIGKGHAELHDNGKRILITFTPQQENRIGQLSLPVLAVNVAFEGCDTSQVEHFMAAFDRCFHRGGG